MIAKYEDRKSRKKISGIVHLLFPAILFCLIGCNGYESSIPARPVYINWMNVYQLKTIGSYLYIDKTKLASDRIGFGGILVVHAYDDNFYAFDLACPVEANENVRVGIPEGLICKCDSCGESYDLSFGLGTPLNHISKQGLKRYSVRVDENFNVTVTK
jgi:nitrite reductase/ring-hydroxylating ferredoxin subunit